MPTIRYQIRNEYGLADPDLYRAADKDDPEAVLEGVAMAGLVGVLRQLGDIAEFAAGIFHDLHEEVTATSARGHGLMLRVQQLEAEFPSIEKAFLVQTNHSNFAYDEGIDWRANLRINQNLITQGDMPRFILDSYEECRGPPRLFMLDKFDVAGAGACLKRYSDPSFFKVEFASSGMMEEEVQIEKKVRKIRKRASRWRNGDTTESFLAALVNSNLQQERDDKVSARVPNRRVKLKSRNLHELDITSRRSYMEHLLEVHSFEQKVLPANSISHSPVDVKPIESSGLTSEVHETVIDTITDSTITREAYPIQSPTRKEVAYIPRNELDGRHVKNIRKLKFVPKERILTESEIKDEVSDDGYMPSKAENRSPLFQDVELRKSCTDGEFTIKGGFDGDKSNGYRSDEAEKNPTKESLGYVEFNPVGEYEDYRSDTISSDLENYVDALNAIGSEIEMDSESRVKSDPGFSNTVVRTIDSGIYEHQQDVPVKPLEPDSVEKFTSSREWNIVLQHFPNSVISGDLIVPQQPLQHDNRDNFHKESPDRTPDEIQGNSEVRECALLPIETSDAKESDVTGIMSEVREASADSLVMNLMCSSPPDDTISNYMGGTHAVSEQLDGKAEGLNFSNNHDDFSCETILLSEVGDLSFSGRYMPGGIDPAECVEEQISEFDMSGHHSKDHSASEENPAQHIEESTVTLTANSEEQQESVKESGACFDGDVLPNIMEASPENDASIVNPAVLAEEILGNDVNNSHEVTRDLDGILPHADMEFTDPIINSRVLSDDLLRLSDIPHTEDVGRVFFKDMEDAQGETIPEEALIGHVENSLPLSSVQLRASHDPVEQDNKAASCEIMSPSNFALSRENSHFTKQPDVLAMGVENTVTCDEDNAEVVDVRETLLLDIVPIKLERLSDVDDSQKFNGVNSEELLTLSSEKETFLDGMQLQLNSSVEDAGENNIVMPNVKPLELGHFSDVEEPEACDANSMDKVPLDSASVISSADMQLQDDESECMVNSNAEELKESPLAASIEHLPSDSVNETFLDDKQLSNKEDHMVASNAEDPKESSSADSGEHFSSVSADEMFPDDIQVRNKERRCMEIDGAESAADTMGLPCGSYLPKESLQLEKHIDDDPLDEYVIVEADDNNQGTCSAYSNSGKTSGFDVQLEYLSDQDNVTPPAQNESQPTISTEISSSILPIQHLSDDSNPSDAKLLDNVCCNVSSEDSKPNIDKEDLIYYSSKNEDSGSKEGISPSTNFLLETNTAPGDGSEPNVVFSHQKGVELEDSDTQFQRPCTNDNKSISIDIEDEPPKPEPCVVDSIGEANELDTSLCNIGMPEKVESEASVASRCSSEISELQPIASSSQVISETSLQEAIETWLDEPTYSFHLPDADETPPLPPLPPLEWRLGSLRLASLTSSGDTVQPPMVTNPFVEQTARVEKYPQGSVKAVVEMFQTEMPFASLPLVVENERYQHGSFISEEETVQSSRSSEFPPIADEEGKQKSLYLDVEMTNPSSSLQVSHGEDGKFTTGQGEWQHEQHKRLPLAHLIPSLELERSQHEHLSVATDPIPPINPFSVGPTIEEWNHQYGYGVYGGGSAQQLNLPPPLEARGLNMPPYGFLYSMGENPSTVYNFMIPTADGDQPNWRYRSIRDRPRDPLIEAVAAHDKSKLRKVTELDRSSVKQKTDERDSLLEQIRNKSFNLKPANAMKPNIKGVPPTNLKVAAILQKANAIRQACAGSDEDEDDGDSWNDT